MPITPLPTPPSRQDPANFAARGDALLTALPAFVTEVNTLAEDVNAKQALATRAAVTSQAALDAGVASVAPNAAVASASAVAAEAARVAAVAAQNNAVAVVTGGTGSLTAAPGKLPLGDAGAALDSSWFPAGPGPAQLPANLHLGRLAFLDVLGVITPMLSQPLDLKTVWFEFSSNTSLKLCMRGDDGVVRSFTFTLS